MTEMELLVRETLGRHEAEIPASDPLDVRQVTVRARRRQVRNLLGVGTVALLVVIGAASGIQAILRAEGKRPAIQPTPTPTIPPPAEDAVVGPVGFAQPGDAPSLPVDGDAVITVTAVEDSGAYEYETTQVTIFADGRMIWRRDRCAASNSSAHQACDPIVRSELEREPVTGWVEQRLTPEAIAMLREELIATGFFQRDHEIMKPFDSLIEWFTVSLAIDGRVVTVHTNSNLLTEPLSSRQRRALSRMEELVADPSSTLPDSAFADRRIRAFVPSGYWYAFRWKPTPQDLAELPPPADALVHHACGTVTTEQARAIADALNDAGVRRLDTDRTAMAYKWAGGQERQRFRLEPLLPDGVPPC